MARPPFIFGIKSCTRKQRVGIWFRGCETAIGRQASNREIGTTVATSANEVINKSMGPSNGKPIMRKFQDLSTQVYYREVLREEQREYRRLRNRRAIRDLLTFLFGLGAMAVGVFLVEHQATWMPAVEQLQDAVRNWF